VRRFWKLAGVTALAVIVGPVLAAAPAFADGPSGYGFDDTPHVIVGGGSDTTWKVMTALTGLYNTSAGCVNQLSILPTTNDCLTTSGVHDAWGGAAPYLGNWQHDTIAQAYPAGSSTGIASLNGFVSGANSPTYNGAVNPFPGYSGLSGVDGGNWTSTASGPQVDFARSSRTPKTSGGDCNLADSSVTPARVSGNELVCDTFWGYAEDSIQIVTFNSRVSQVQTLLDASNGGLTANDLDKIYKCQYTQWGQVPGLASLGTDPIVPWGMNTNSGTYNTFRDYIRSNTSPADTTFDPNTAGNGWNGPGTTCARLTKDTTQPGNVFVPPLENDIKPLAADPANIGSALSSTASSVNNPANWLWWGSFGVFSAFPYTSSTTVGTFAVNGGAAPLNSPLIGPGGNYGAEPASNTTLAGTYGLVRTLYHVTRKPDADCAAANKSSSGSCSTMTGTDQTDFPGSVSGPSIGGGNVDINVAGGTSGVSGGIREFTRWLCRVGGTQYPNDPFTGRNYFQEIKGAINGAGFTIAPASIHTPGSSCQVVS
jgi:ABC-type phosphate transport system substrate-binding protein